jgi:hypothetical protein
MISITFVKGQNVTLYAKIKALSIVVFEILKDFILSTFDLLDHPCKV